LEVKKETFHRVMDEYGDYNMAVKLSGLSDEDAAAENALRNL
jgi:hypothetical protein